MKPLFLKAIANARNFMLKSVRQRKLDKEKKLRQQEGGYIFIWNTMIKTLPCKRFKIPFLEWFSTPLEKQPFNEIVSVRGAKVPVDAMIIANHRILEIYS